MFNYPRPPNDNEYLYDLDIEIDKKWCLEYYRHSAHLETSYEDIRPGSRHDNWKIVRTHDFEYADDVIDMLGLTGVTVDYRPRFYKLEANTVLVPHVDLDTKCSLNFVLSKQAAPVTFETNHHFQYTYALFNTSREHGVINGPHDRILFKISIMDKTFDEIKSVINAQNVSKSNYSRLSADPLFEKSRSKYDSLPKLDRKIYQSIHTKNLIPLPIKIDCDLFEQEIQQHTAFEQFGITHTNLQRYSLALTDLASPVISTPAPANWPMDIWLVNNPDTPLFDTDFKYPNDTFQSITSLQPFLTEFESELARCCILKWNTGAHFKPHLDVSLPAPNLRLWGTNDPANNHFCFWNDQTQQYEEETGIERGRLYLADTSKYHHAYSTAESVYTFFFALQVTAYDKINEMLRSQASDARGQLPR